MDILERLYRTMPKHIKPVAKTADEHLAAMEKISQEKAAADHERNKQNRVKIIMGSSGISPLHQDCSFENYTVKNKGQQAALEQAKKYADNFGKGFGGFIFSGSCGTGKNHLAAAICNQLVACHYSVLCITVPELMSKLKETFSKNYTGLSEQKILDDLCKIDLLILDEIGVQKESSDYTKIILNQIIDKRTSHKKPIGILTNLNHEKILDVLGERAMDRMVMDGGLWVNFNWESYRKNVKTLAN